MNYDQHQQFDGKCPHDRFIARRHKNQDQQSILRGMGMDLQMNLGDLSYSSNLNSYSSFIGDIFRGNRKKYYFQSAKDKRNLSYPSLSSFCKYQIRQQVQPKTPNLRSIFVKQIPDSNITNDFYHNILDWSHTNILAFAKQDIVKVVCPSDSDIQPYQIFQKPDCVITALKFNIQSPYIVAIGGQKGITNIVDFQKRRQIMELKGHVGKINSLDWFGNMIAIGGKEGVISVRDIRQNPHKEVYYYKAHLLDICNIKWDASGTRIASGGSDRTCLIVCTRTRKKIFSGENYLGGIRALQWSPFNPSVLVFGGGLKDRRIRLIDTNVPTYQSIIETDSQVCGLIFSKHSNQLVSLHNGTIDQIKLWQTYHTLHENSKVQNIRKKVNFSGCVENPMYSALGPSGEVIATSSSDNIKLWKIFPKDCNYRHQSQLEQSSLRG